MNNIDFDDIPLPPGGAKEAMEKIKESFVEDFKKVYFTQEQAELIVRFFFMIDNRLNEELKTYKKDIYRKYDS